MKSEIRNPPTHTVLNLHFLIKKNFFVFSKDTAKAQQITFIEVIPWKSLPMKKKMVHVDSLSHRMSKGVELTWVLAEIFLKFTLAS